MLHEQPDQFATAPSLADHARLLDEDEARLWAAEIIGDDLVRGLAELREIRAIEKVVYAEENAISTAMEQGVGPDNDEGLIAAEETWPGLKEARTAADNIGALFFGTFEHVRSLPVRSVVDVEVKVRFLVEFGDYGPDDYPPEPILKQIADFFDARPVPQ